MKVAIIDSGIHAAHPHVQRVAGGINLSGEGAPEDILDRAGHGTAVAGAIRRKAPEANLYAVKVFDRWLSANIKTILHAIEWCMEQKMDLINLSLGTDNPAHSADFERVLEGSPPVVSAAGLLPGSLPGVIAVAAGPQCGADQLCFRDGIFYASPYPRPIPGVPVERNLSGVSFAVANVTGFLAASLARETRPCTVEKAREALLAAAHML